MLLLQANKMSKSFGTDLILSNINLEVQSQERIALVGKNGSGKSTLLKIFAGELSYDSGHLTLAKDVSIGYLEQNSKLESNETLFQELLKVFAPLVAMEKDLREMEVKMADPESFATSKEYEKFLSQYDQLQTSFTQLGGYTYESDIRSVLNGLGFGSFPQDMTVNMLSGGQKTRLSLGKLLLTKPDLLILDEPTNHLDIETLTWLENYLQHYPGALLLVSHDRYFLDRIVNKVYEISRGESTKYHGNYSKYLDQKAANYEREKQLYEKQQKEVADLQDFIQRNIVRASTTKRAQSRRKKLEKMELLDRPAGDDPSARFSFTILKQSGNDVLHVEDLSIGYHRDQPINAHLSFSIRRTESVALVGPNGVGKTTLIKTIASQLPKLAGSVTLGSQVTIGYYDQEQSTLSTNKTVLNELWDDFPTTPEKDIRTVLGNFLFTGDDVLKPVYALSGGEKARLALAKLMMKKDNFLILDEPTNHLDLDSKEVLEAAIIDFPGTVLFVSHDRYFINRITTRVLELTSEGLTDYLGDYDYYINKKAEQEEIERMEQEKHQVALPEKERTEGRHAFEEDKRAKKEERRRQRRIEELEEHIESIEQSISEKEEQLLNPEIYSDHDKARELNDEIVIAKEQLDTLMDEWTSLQT
ncbi:ATP-binding cassette subfamily F protein 3 [Pullulanibacillus pueri]|uniref:Putative ABC transporter ATP-binding protein YdiF n=1 Tax=Pullulanibacillus pueri TaxID=1437324 RepID=A0A8J2ZXK8_9BACL|nr:ABC-F type ribosomal protection protein [Pullulanibacillus pueri]MBM7682835.1 ATP-binding cassette subfamily F protein 3 [Pullulanibacillus pueri]GGH83381.1 putative ABC transporter ATP-binding protein YdiF [Pullulanibacillus pueri]